MTHHTCPDSFDRDESSVAVGPAGQLAHQSLIDHTERFERQVHQVGDHAWSIVGNGLSNQNAVEGPDGLIVIDTGESVEEMSWALEAFAEHTDAPVAAVMYTHYHYVGGTSAIDGAGTDIAIHGHGGIVGNRQRVGVDLSAAAVRGLVHQFGMLLPPDGPDGLVNVGLGVEFRRADHAPFTDGFIAPTETFTRQTTATIAGLQVEITPAPSDADDSVTIWFPELGVAVNNLVWPVLFNIFAIRGEEYRDPRVLVEGIDHLLGLEPEHLIGAHGPPISGTDRIKTDVTRYRDSIQFIWDQSVRGINQGLTTGELIEFVQLPESYGHDYLTQQHYGVVEHHVRQVHAGLRGWFDGDESELFPLPTADRCRRLVELAGGADAVRAEVQQALANDDLRWALELATWLVRREAHGEADVGDRRLLAETLRSVSRRTTSANVRNWCLTRALELDGSLDLDRFRVHRFARGAVLTNPPDITVHALRVLVDPEGAAGVDDHLRWRFNDGTTVGLRIRNQVAVPTDGTDAELEIGLDLATWAELLSSKLTFGEAVSAGSVQTTGDRSRIERVLGSFDHEALRS